MENMNLGVKPPESLINVFIIYLVVRTHGHETIMTMVGKEPHSKNFDKVVQKNCCRAVDSLQRNNKKEKPSHSLAVHV